MDVLSISYPFNMLGTMWQHWSLFKYNKIPSLIMGIITINVVDGRAMGVSRYELISETLCRSSNSMCNRK